MSTPAIISSVSPQESQAVAALAPLATDLFLAAGPFVVPVGLLASTAWLDDADTRFGALVRDFVAADPWSGMGSVTSGHWILIAYDDDNVVIGQRRGAVGIERIVTFARGEVGFEAVQMSGLRLTTGRSEQSVQPVLAAALDGQDLTLTWDCSADLAGEALRDVVRVGTAVVDQVLHVLIVATALRRSRAPAGLSVGTGMMAETVVDVSKDPSWSHLVSDHWVPPVAVSL